MERYHLWETLRNYDGSVGRFLRDRVAITSAWFGRPTGKRSQAHRTL